MCHCLSKRSILSHQLIAFFSSFAILKYFSKDLHDGHRPCRCLEPVVLRFYYYGEHFRNSHRPKRGEGERERPAIRNFTLSDYVADLSLEYPRRDKITSTGRPFFFLASFLHARLAHFFASKRTSVSSITTLSDNVHYILALRRIGTTIVVHQSSLTRAGSTR